MSKKTTKKNDHANRRQFLGIGGAAAATVALGAITNKAQTTDGTCLTGACATDVAKLSANGRAVHVIGNVANGKVTFDQASLDAFAKAFPDAEMCFVAVNAPFDPVAQANA
jgi:hypothetical protein